MRKWMHKLLKWGTKRKQRFLICVGCAALWGLAAYLYMFINGALTHDSLYEFYCDTDISASKIMSGRIFVPLYEKIIGNSLTLPWLTGILSLLYIAAAVFLVTEIFKISKKAKIFVVAGIFTVNITVISLTTSYLHDLDCDLFAMLLAVLAVYFWDKFRFGYLIGIPCITVAMGLYQSYISTAITLILLVLILEILNGKSAKDIIIRGLRAVVMLVGAGLLYLAALKVTYAVTGLAMRTGHYNSMDSLASASLGRIIYVTLNSYFVTVYKMFFPVSAYSTTTTVCLLLAMIFPAAILILKKIIGKEIGWKEKVLCLLLILLLPIGMNISRILTNGMSHDVMHFAIWLVYLFVLLIVWDEEKTLLKKCCKTIALTAMIITLFGNVKIANVAGFAKQTQQRTTAAYGNRIIMNMEQTEGFDAAKTSVAFIGNPEALYIKEPEYEIIEKLTGIEYSMVGVGHSAFYNHYFDYVLDYPLKTVSEEKLYELEHNPIVDAMPIYPQKGSIQKVGEVLVVKLADAETAHK